MSETLLQQCVIDMRSFAEFMTSASDKTVSRRLNDDARTLNYYLDYLNAIKLLTTQQDGYVFVDGQQLTPIAKAVKDATQGASTVIDNLTSTDKTKALSANQGKVLNTKLSNLKVIDNLTSTDKTKALSANQGRELKALLGSGFSQDFAINGWCKLPNGLIMQWGVYTGDSSFIYTSRNIQFNIAFPTKCLFVCPISEFNTGSGLNDGEWQVTGKNNISFSAFAQLYRDTGITKLPKFSWFAIGH